MSKLPTATTASSTLAEQAITASLTAETMVDPDDGHLALLAYTKGNAGDLQEVVPARLLRMVAEARAKLDQIERLANVFEAEDTTRAILAEHNLTLREVDPASITEHFGGLAYRLRCWAGKENGQLIVWAPAGQDPIERVNALASLVNDPDSVVREG